MKFTLPSLFILSLALNISSSAVLAHENQQVTLDKACEAARQVALKPRRKEIYQECRNKFKKNEVVCKREALSFNGNRIGGAPLFYELPDCVKAFNYRKQQTE